MANQSDIKVKIGDYPGPVIRVGSYPGPLVSAIQYGSQSLKTLSDVDARILTDGYGLVYSAANNNFFLTNIGATNLILDNVANLQIAQTQTNANISLLFAIDTTQNTNIQSAWNTANQASSNTVYLVNVNNTQNNNITYIFGVNDSQNTVIQNLQTYLNANLAYIQSINDSQNTTISNLQTALNSNVTYNAGVNSYQNTAIGNANTLAQTATSLATTASANTVYTFGVDATQNSNIQLAWSKANNALPNTGAFITVNDTSSLIIANTTQSKSTTTGALQVKGGLGVSGNVYANNVTANSITVSRGTNIINGDTYINVLGSADNTFIGSYLGGVQLSGSLTLSGYNTYIDASESPVRIATTGLTPGVEIGAASAGQITYLNDDTTNITGQSLFSGTLNEFLGPIKLTNLTASQSLFTDANKKIVSKAVTGSGNTVLSIGPTFDTSITLSGVAPSQAVFTDANRSLVGVPTIGTGSVVLGSALSSNVSYIAGVDATQNTNISNLQSGLSSNVSYIAGVDADQNTRILAANTLAQSAYTLAGTKFNSNGGTIAGNVTIQNNLNVLGSISYTGNVTSIQVTGNTGQFFGYAANGFNALYAGIPTGYLLEPQISVQVSSNYNGYAGINMQNINSGSNSSSDLFITADNGTINDGFVDLGMGSSTYSYPGYNLIGKNDGYLFATGNTTTGGGNMIIGTGLLNDVIFATGGITTTNEVMRITSANTVVIKTQVPSTSTTTGALQVKGGLGVTGNVYANNVTVNNLTASQAVFTDTNKNLVSVPTIGTGSVVLSNSPTLTGAVTIGSTTGTDTLTFGQSTNSQTVNIATGDTALTKTKTINIGTGGSNGYSTIIIGRITPYYTTSIDLMGSTNIHGTQFDTLNIFGFGGIEIDPSVQFNSNLNANTVFVYSSLDVEGSVRIGSTSKTSSLTLGQSSNTELIEIGKGATTSTKTKTINLGVGGLSGSNTNINIGSSVAGANGSANFSNMTVVSIANTRASTSNTTGALVVAGGLGVSGNVYANAVYSAGLPVLTSEPIGSSASANTIYTFGVDATQNTNISNLGTYLSSNVAYISGVDATQNTNIQLAWNKANNALPNTGGIVTGNVSFLLGLYDNIVIGNTNPTKVTNSTTFPKLQLIGASNPSNTTILIEGYSTSITLGIPTLAFHKVANNTIGGGGQSGANHRLGSIDFYGTQSDEDKLNLSSSFSGFLSAQIRSTVDKTPVFNNAYGAGANTIPASLNFFTTPSYDGSSTTPVNRVSISSNGNINFGTYTGSTLNEGQFGCVSITKGLSKWPTTNSMYGLYVVTQQTTAVDLTNINDIVQIKAENSNGVVNYKRAIAFKAEGIPGEVGVYGVYPTVNTQIGFLANNNIIGANNNYGFISDLTANTSGTQNTWNFYASGNANNYFAGTTTFGKDIIVNGVTVGRGNGNVATNLIVANTVSPFMTTANYNNTAIGSGALKTAGKSIRYLGPITGGQGYGGTFYNNVVLEYLSGTPVIPGGQYPTVNISVAENFTIDGCSLVNAGWGFVDTTTRFKMPAGLDPTGTGFSIGIDSLIATTDTTAIGTNAGYNIGGSLGGVYIGSGAIGTGGSINEIAIGYNSVGSGDNSVTIGNQFTNTTWLKGNAYVSGLYVRQIDNYGTVVGGSLETQYLQCNQDFNLYGGTANPQEIATNQTTGGLYIGGASIAGAMGPIELGRSLGTQTVGIAVGVNSSSSRVKTVNIGTGATGGNTNIFIGPSAATGPTNIVIGCPTGKSNTRVFGTVLMANTLASTSNTTGALVVSGGVGISGNTNISGTITGTGSLQLTGSTTGGGNIATSQTSGTTKIGGTGGSLWMGQNGQSIRIGYDPSYIFGHAFAFSSGSVSLGTGGQSVEIGTEDSEAFSRSTTTFKGDVNFSAAQNINWGIPVINLFNSYNYSYYNLNDRPIAANEPYTSFAYASTITPLPNTNRRIICTGNLTINSPSTSSIADGTMVRMWITASGADRTVSLQNTIKLPRSSFFTSPQTIISGDKARLSLQYDLTRNVWELVSFVNGY